jgi:phage FluMu gp28-like protein
LAVATTVQVSEKTLRLLNRLKEETGLKNAQGIMLSLPKKQEVMVYLKQLMQNGQVHIPYDRELISELNLEQYEIMKTGQIRFDHPTGTHDDRLWAFARAVYASRPEVPEYRPAIVLGKSRRLRIGPKKGSWEEKFKTRREWQ